MAIAKAGGIEVLVALARGGTDPQKAKAARALRSLAMNADKLTMHERCASTSNRNFEGRQGRGGRTHLVSPEMAAAAAVTGHLTDIRDF